MTRGRIMIDLFTTLDGVAQAPGGPVEDPRDGFRFGGWQAPIDFGFVHTWPDTVQSFYGLMWFVMKICFFFFLIAMVKAIVPRYRYDQLMRLGWKVFLPTSLVAVILVAAWRVFGPGGA